jgi:hypothetical protein
LTLAAMVICSDLIFYAVHRSDLHAVNLRILNKIMDQPKYIEISIPVVVFWVMKTQTAAQYVVIILHTYLLMELSPS